MNDLLYILQLTTTAEKEAQCCNMFVIDSDAKLEEAKRTLPTKIYIDNYYLQHKLLSLQNSIDYKTDLVAKANDALTKHCKLNFIQRIRNVVNLHKLLNELNNELKNSSIG